MRKFLDQNFWSHGTPLGSLGALSQQDTILGAGQLQILVIWGPYRPPVVVALETHAENLKTVGAWCESSIYRPTAYNKRESRFKDCVFACLLTTMYSLYHISN